MTTKEIQEELKKGKGIATYDSKELLYISKPIGKEIYKKALELPTGDYEDKKGDQPAKWSDKLTCKICGKVVSRSNQSKHRKSNQHQIYLSMNAKIRKMLLD
jgi:hypothetical protein